MRNILDWLKSHSPFDYLLGILLLSIILVTIGIPHNIIKSNHLKKELNGLVSDYTKEWDKRDKNKKTETKSTTSYLAKSTDDVINNFITTQNELLDAYHSEIQVATTSITFDSSQKLTDINNKFGTGITPTVSGQNNNLVIVPQGDAKYSIASSGLTPLGNQQYDGQFTISTNGNISQIITYTFDSNKNTIGNLSIYKGVA